MNEQTARKDQCFLFWFVLSGGVSYVVQEDSGLRTPYPFPSPSSWYYRCLPSFYIAFQLRYPVAHVHCLSLCEPYLLQAYLVFPQTLVLCGCCLTSLLSLSFLLHAYLMGFIYYFIFSSLCMFFSWNIIQDLILLPCLFFSHIVSHFHFTHAEGNLLVVQWCTHGSSQEGANGSHVSAR